ncbi:MAG: hypothetical protein IJL67_11975 [Oscillospiraceae bacterium]|nr:hypothetical protein [Oscillospiraceae bacterium]
MSISYRLKKKELVLLLDLFGDAGSLEQNFGDIFISREEYDENAEALHKKGFVNTGDKTISPESGIALMMKHIYSAPLALADTGAGVWIYCSADLAVMLKVNTAFGMEYRLYAAASDEERSELCGEFIPDDLKIIRGSEAEFDELAGFIKESQS